MNKGKRGILVLFIELAHRSETLLNFVCKVTANSQWSLPLGAACLVEKKEASINTCVRKQTVTEGYNTAKQFVLVGREGGG